MCGIAGLYVKNGAGEEALRSMAAAIAHRGPDAEGVFVDGSFGLAHRRLSVLDLSMAAHQPMTSACGRYVIVYNGEVYNFRELRAELGLNTRTTSDTEVIIEAFAKLGPQMVTRLNGMFAIAIFDKQERRLFLFRDRLGIKPIYIYRANGSFAFASELKSIVAVEDILPLTINRDAIPYFLHLGYIPQPLSIYREVTKFPSGHWAEFDGNELRTHRYWSPEEAVSKDVLTDEAEAKARLSELLTASVRRRLVSDVPFGTFLSGGIDSSLITALAQQESEERVRTFSIGFDNARHNEAHFAEAVAKHLDTDHHAYTVTEKDALELVTEILPQYDEPYADSSAIPTMLVSKLARQEVTMTLSGDGGDELFHGYGAYQWAERLVNPLISGLRKPASLLMSMGNDRFRRVSKLLDYGSETPLHSHIFSQEQGMFSVAELRGLLVSTEADMPLLFPANIGFNGLSRKLFPAEQQAFFDLNFYLKDDLLVKVDRATMRYGLETRVPLLDHTVVEFALNLHPSLKMKDGVSKYLLKQVLYDLVPKELFDRPKWGFSIPLAEWLQGKLSFLLSDVLNEKTVNEAGLVNWAVVSDLKQRFALGHTHLYNRLWLLILLHLWLDGRGRGKLLAG